MTISNRLTLMRLLLSPLFFFLFLYGGILGKLLAFVVFALEELSDLFDGFIARSRKEVTDFGKIFDPFADSLSRFTYFITFLAAGLIPGWMVLIIFYRDSLVSALRLIASLRGEVVAARISGKFKAEVQAIGVLLVLLLINLKNLFHIEIFASLHSTAYTIFFIVTMVTLLSAFDYTIANFHHVQKVKK